MCKKHPETYIHKFLIKLLLEFCEHLNYEITIERMRFKICTKIKIMTNIT